jgi:hypothetical protein
LPCIPGKSATGEASTSCTECTEGKYQSEISSKIACSKCPIGYAQSMVAATR